MNGVKIGGTWISSEYLRSFATAEEFADHAHTRIFCEGLKDYITDVEQRKQVLMDLYTANVSKPIEPKTVKRMKTKETERT